MSALGTVGSLETDMYVKVDDDLCRCRWCGWSGRQHNLPRSAHERSLAHRSAARARGVELPRPVRVHNRPVPVTLKDDIHRRVEPVDKPPRKLPKPRRNWGKHATDRTDEWWSDGPGAPLRVRKLGVEGDERRYTAYHGVKYVGSENTLERAQALAEHPELE